MNIKKWPFPTYDEWEEADHSWSGTLGDYHCEIKVTCWGHDFATYGIAISTSSIPHNVYVERVLSAYRRIENSNKYELQEWYNKSILEINNKWQDYIRSTYLE